MTSGEHDGLPKGCDPGICHLLDFCCGEETGYLPPCGVSNYERGYRDGCTASIAYLNVLESNAAKKERDLVLKVTEQTISGFLLHLYRTHLKTDVTAPADVEYVMLKIKESLRGEP